MNKIINWKTKRQPLRLIKRSEMAKYFTMLEAIDSMAHAFACLSSGQCFVPKRYITSIGDESLTFLLKPAFIKNHDKSSIKILTQKSSNSFPDIPTILGVVLLIDNVTGEILSIMDGEFITALRTGAASGLATKYFSREDSRNLAIFGCGSQGRTQLSAVTAVRKIENIWVFDKSCEQAELFIEEMNQETSLNIEYTCDLAILKDVDIICTATNSIKPLFYKSHIKKGTHINAIGSFQPEMQEIDPEIIESSRIFLDDKEACINESGDLIDAANNTKILKENIIGEVGDYILNKIKGRISLDDITLFKSVGTAIQDLVIADRIYNKSLNENFGEEIRLYE